jgi:60 kDa SS-A/Ro ribonucleoprotein
MNLNTFARHGVLEDARLAKMIAERLRSPAAIRAAGAFPYQLLVAYAAANDTIPRIVRDALHDAMEIATSNVPEVAGNVYVCCDVSGSMQSPVTGFRKGATTAVRCVDVAALMAAVILRKNRNAQVLCFDHRVIEVPLEPRDSVFTNARLLASVGGGATACSAPLALLHSRGAPVDLVILVSDNESWVDPARGRGTQTMEMWSQIERRNPGARLVCIDMQPYGTTQAAERPNILNVGGFSDAVFDVVGAFASGSMDPEGWVGMIRRIEL